MAAFCGSGAVFFLDKPDGDEEVLFADRGVLSVSFCRDQPLNSTLSLAVTLAPLAILFLLLMTSISAIAKQYGLLPVFRFQSLVAVMRMYRAVMLCCLLPVDTGKFMGSFDG